MTERRVAVAVHLFILAERTNIVLIVVLTLRHDTTISLMHH